MNRDELKFIGEKITHIPADFNLHPTIRKIYEQRRKSIEEGTGIDFGTA
jgi:2-oxoglutarate dehydrogenase E1 component